MDSGGMLPEYQHGMDNASGLTYTPGEGPVSAFAGANMYGYYENQASINLDFQLLKARLRLAAQGLQPAICRRRTGEAEMLYEMGIRVPDWHMLKKIKGAAPRPLGSSGMLARPVPRPKHTEVTVPRPSAAPVPKLSRAIKSKSNGHGRTYTSKFRGVHQTFPTKRWEAQFRRNGKPTSLGCFDHEEEAARAYDKMMLWCELHNTAGVKGGITNYDPAEYEKDIPWLQSITQDELIEALRSDGRRQAAHRMLRQKREGQHSVLSMNTDSAEGESMDMS